MKYLGQTVGRGALALSLACGVVPAAQAAAAPAAKAADAVAQAGAPVADQQGVLTVPTQSAPGGPTAAVAPDPAQSGDIIVTAQKRAENVQTVPLAVSVLAPAQLAAAGVRQFDDLGRIAPSLVVRPAQHPVNANVSLRGVGTFAFGIGVESSVAVLVDEVPLAFQARAFSDLPDVERIEVLRGPQSTLYGKSASAGLINIITREPTDTLRVRANSLVTTDGEYGGNVSVSGPISDQLGYVFSASYSQWDGNGRNLILNRNVGGRQSVNSRGKLRWEPTDNLKVTLSGNYLNGNTTVGRPYVRVAANARFLGIAAYPNSVSLPGITPSQTNQDIADNYLSRTRYEGGGGSLRGELGLGDMTLIYIGSVDKFRLDDFNDQDGTATPGAVGRNVELGTFRSNLVTQELRLLSPGEKAFRYTLGAFYSRTRFERPFYRGPAFVLANWEATARSRQVAAYLQVDWEIVPKLTLTGGGRIQNEKVGYTYRDILNGDARFRGDTEDTAETYKISGRYQLTPDLMFFANYATGYKGQTYDLTTGFNAARAAAGPIRPETSRDREVGVRAQFLDRRLTFNVTAFDTDFKDLQAQTIETVGLVSNYRLTNVGGLSTRGIEVESSARVGSDLNLNGAVTYLDAKYSSFPVAQCYPGQTAATGCTGNPAFQNLTGKRAAQAPTWRFSVAGDYSPALSDDLRGIAQVNWQYQSDINYGTTDPESFQAAYSIVNAGLGVRDKDRRWEVIAFVNNVFDKQYFPVLINQASLFGGAQATQGILPRDFRRYGGLRLGVNF